MRLEFELEVQYRDLDPLGHVNNAVYLSYFEHARVKMFEKLYDNKPHYNFVVAHVEVDYIKPIFLEKIKVISWISNIGRTSFKIDYEIYNSKNELCTKGFTIQVMFDPVKQQKVEIENDFRDYLKSFMI